MLGVQMKRGNIWISGTHREGTGELSVRDSVLEGPVLGTRLEAASLAPGTGGVGVSLALPRVIHDVGAATANGESVEGGSAEGGGAITRPGPRDLEKGV